MDLHKIGVCALMGAGGSAVVFVFLCIFQGFTGIWLARDPENLLLTLFVLAVLMGVGGGCLVSNNKPKDHES